MLSGPKRSGSIAAAGVGRVILVLGHRALSRRRIAGFGQAVRADGSNSLCEIATESPRCPWPSGQVCCAPLV
jgi:hypothetical protein